MEAMSTVLLKWSQKAISALPSSTEQVISSLMAISWSVICHWPAHVVFSNCLVFQVYGNSFSEGLFHNVSWDWLKADSSVVSEISFLGGGYIFVLFQSLRTGPVLHDLSEVKQRDFAVLLANFLSTLRPSTSGS